MNRTRAVAVGLLVGLLVALASCNGNGGEEAASAPTEFFVTANETSLDITTFTVPADTEFTLTFTNNDDGVAHSISMYRSQEATDAVFEGEVFEGRDRREYRVPALEAGSYLFRCEVHPNQMSGTVVAQ